MDIEKTDISSVSVYNSFTGDKIGTVPQSTKQDVLDALDLAKKGEAIGGPGRSKRRKSIVRQFFSRQAVLDSRVGNICLWKPNQLLVICGKSIERRTVKVAEHSFLWKPSFFFSTGIFFFSTGNFWSDFQDNITKKYPKAVLFYGSPTN